ncbi:glutamate receptor 3.5-like [Cornus florida]|uniref:glutamate receptor 3.5-like n=1 Tax=Cornus florida TaxID=4283 RepID=UPI0028A07F80|nr:glutamate receptor 3.5-like [Cornus florida]
MTFLVLISNSNIVTFKLTFLLFHVFISFLLFLSHGSIAEADKVTLHIGAIIDVDSRIGKEQKIAMKIALYDFNNKSELHKLSLRFRSAHVAEELIKEKQVQVIIGMEIWEEAGLAADIGSRTQVSVLSFATAPHTPALVWLRWRPIFTQMVTENSNSFREFLEQFQQNFQLDYPEEDNSSEPGIHALRAYDSIITITQAMVKYYSAGKMSSSGILRDSFLSSNFTGLTGEVRFEEGRLSSSQKLSMVNIANRGRSSELGFSDNHSSMKELGDFTEVKWPGDQKRILREELILTDDYVKPELNISVPGRVSFKKFLDAKLHETTGFCIDVYNEVKTILDEDYNIKDLPSPDQFHVYNGNYDDLVESVHNKTFDAAVGDITITTERWDQVAFTVPFIESGLLIVVPVKKASKAWLFLKPFTSDMWVVTVAIFFYTMFIVWFLEKSSNQELISGHWKEQLGNVLWFTFSTLFFAHREKIKSNYTRTVIVAWLFVVLILIESYSASLTSMLTVSRLRTTVPDIEELKRTNATVGCDGATFVRKYLEDDEHFEPGNIIDISSESEFQTAFKNGTIQAAVLEVPYAKVFVNQRCKQYEYGDGSFTRKFGGFGFVFQKDNSTLAHNVSKAILKLSETGKIKELEKKLYTPSSECMKSTTEEKDSLCIEDFLGLFIIYAAISIICFLLYLLKRRMGPQQTIILGSAPPSGNEIEMI